MPVNVLKILLCLVLSWSCSAWSAEPPLVDYGRWNEIALEDLIARAGMIADPGERIELVSRPFLGTPYVADTLVGGPQAPERLVIDLAGVDCYTFLDLVEALRRAENLADFPAQLQRVRYFHGEVDYSHRRHFFSDWVADAGSGIVDLTAAIGQGRVRVAVKQLNRKNDGSLWLPGVPVTRREIAYIPTPRIDRELLSALRTGDYLGIYTEQAGLDVSHTGLLVSGENGPMLRHASSLAGLRRVVDVDLLEYLQGKPGLVVYRAR